MIDDQVRECAMVLSSVPRETSWSESEAAISPYETIGLYESLDVGNVRVLHDPSSAFRTVPAIPVHEAIHDKGTLTHLGTPSTHELVLALLVTFHHEHLPSPSFAHE